MDLLPEKLQSFYRAKQWQLRTHQAGSLQAKAQNHHALIIAATGAGKTMAGFLPILSMMAHGLMPKDGPLALYVTPLKVLAGDIARNLEAPLAHLGIERAIGIRTGDTSSHERARLWEQPPHILILTPEQLALMLSHPKSVAYFADLSDVIIDEIHALAPGKRGDLLSLCLARLRSIGRPRLTGLSATLDAPGEMASWMVGAEHVDIVQGPTAAGPDLQILKPGGHIPWSGHGARHAIDEILEKIRKNRLTLIFVNTRNGAEFLFSQLWLANDEMLPIALHHGSLSKAQRQKVEGAIAEGQLQAVVATSTLDLGVDWGDVDLVVQVGAPKGSGRLMQRIGRANHRLDEASRACLVPSNRFEYLECVGAYDAIMEGRVDPLTLEEGHLDVLAQHITGRACAAPFAREELAKEVRMAPPYAGISDKELEDVFQFVCHGGYALKAYEDLQRLAQVGEQWMIAAPRFRQRYRAQVGTIIDTPMIKVTPSRFVGGVWKPSAESIGDVEEWFAAGLRTGDAFVLGGRAWAVMGHDAERLLVVPAKGQAIAPSYQGGKFPLTTHLAERVRAMIASPQAERLDRQVIEWLSLQREKSVLPKADQMLVETFPRGDRYYLVAYPFDGRLAHQSLGMLLTRRLDRLGLVPMGFCANEYGLAIWLAQDAGQVDMDKLFAEDMLGDDLEEWFRDSAVVKRCFRYAAQIAGLTSKKPAGGQRGTALFSADLIFDVLMRHEPDHVLLRAAMRDAAGEVLDLARLQAALSRMKGAIIHKNLPRVSPLSVPIMLEVGREPIYSADQETLLDDLAGELMVEVGA